jgi:nitrite reductase/ring-hydroxylating ferredoxin subunit
MRLRLVLQRVRKVAATMHDYTDAIGAIEVPEGECASVTINGREVAVINANGVFHAIDDECPHQGAPLSDGIVDAGLIICPLHHWEFDYETGACLEEPDCPVSRHECKVENGRVLIKLADHD